MTGSRLRCIVHDGEKVIGNKAVPSSFHGMSVPEITKKLYKTKDYTYKEGELAGKTEITAIEGKRKQGKDGFQVYLAFVKNGEAIEMGLSRSPLDTDYFQSAYGVSVNMNKLAEYLKHLPPDVELAIVWRYDKGMTQDIVLTENSMTARFGPESPNNFSLLDKKPVLGCGGACNGKEELVFDITEVVIYTGEESNPIRMSTIAVAAPPETFQWDAFTYIEPPRPQSLSIQNQATEFNVRMCWQDDIKQNPISMTSFANPPNTSLPAEATIMLVCAKPKNQSKFEPDDNPIIRMIMNPTERKLWGKLYGFPDEDVKPLKVHRSRILPTFRHAPALESPIPFQFVRSKTPVAKPMPPTLFKSKQNTSIQLTNLPQEKAPETSFVKDKSLVNPSPLPEVASQKTEETPKIKSKKLSRTKKRSTKSSKVKFKKPKMIPKFPPETSEKIKKPQTISQKEPIKSKTQKPRELTSEKPKVSKSKKEKLKSQKRKLDKLQKKKPAKRLHSYFKKKMLGLTGKAKARSSKRRRIR
ncbi:hypothetical protein KKB44_05135 [Candidatus Micrarchaeota archaeon]|nr:hypothetical protein [Candidatus Micrarchaeota archaeon]